MSRKGAFDVSVNFIVMLIVSVVIFSLLLVLVYKWFFISSEKKCELESKLTEELEKSLVFGNSFLTVTPVNKELSGSISFMNCEDTVFTIGVKGMPSSSQNTNEYFIKLECKGLYDESQDSTDNKVCGSNPFLHNQETISQGGEEFISIKDLNPGKVRSFSLIVNPSIFREKGTYVFAVSLYRGGTSQQDLVERKNFYVTVS